MSTIDAFPLKTEKFGSEVYIFLQHIEKGV